MQIPFAIFLAFTTLAGVWATGVVELTSSNFNTYVGNGKPAFVELYV